MKFYAIAFLLFLAAASANARAQDSSAKATGSISGTVTAADGTPVQGAWVMLTLQPPSALDAFTPVNTSALTGQDGSFSATGLPDGTYQVCPSAPATLYLNPCLWSATPPTAAVAGGQPTTGVAATMQTGYQQVIHISDPQKLLAKNQGVTPGAELIVGVGVGNAPFNSAAVSAKGDVARELTIVLPTGCSGPISVYSSFYKLADQSGSALTASSVPIPTASAKQPASDGTAGAPVTPGPIVLQIVGTN